MRLKTIKTVQVKCNFCFDWMRLNTQTRLNINVCDQCLTKASGPSTLSAVSSNGEIYQFYMVKKNTNISTLKEENHLTNWLENYQRYDDQNLQNTQENLKTEFLEDIDQYRNAQIQQILLKWGLLTNFFNEKQELSNQDVQYLKKMCSQYINEHKKINQKLIESVTVEQFPKQIQVNFLKNQLKMQREPLSEIKILDHSNLNIAISKTSEHNMKKIYQMKNQITQSIIFTSPKKNLRALVQKENQQKFEINAYSVQKQQSNQRTFHQDFSKLEYQFSDYDSSLNSSSITQSDLYLPLGEMKSSRHSLFLTTVTKRSKQELLKTYELIRNRISKYLLQKYESSSLTRLMFNMVFEAFQNTSTIGKSLQLVAYNLSFLDFGCYLQAFDWSTVQIVKLVKVKLKDEQLKILVQFLYVKNISIKTLVLTGNKLTQKSLSYFQSHKIDGLQQIYLGKNRIKKFQVRRNIASLRENYRLHL